MGMELLIAANVLFMIFFFVIAYLSIRYFINQIEKYPRVTFEEVYNSKKLRQNIILKIIRQILMITDIILKKLDINQGKSSFMVGL